jgi:hypothetical protein
MLAVGEPSQQRLLCGPKGSDMQITARKQSELKSTKKGNPTIPLFSHHMC